MHHHLLVPVIAWRLSCLDVISLCTLAADRTLLTNPLFSLMRHTQLRIDLDVRKIMELYEEGSDESIANAKKIYEEGSFSKSVSDLTIAGGLAVDVPQGTIFEGVSFTDDATTATGRQATTVQVFAYNAASAGATTLTVQYVNEGCYVGANPDPETTGCLASAGSLTSTGGNTTIAIDSYTYDVLSSRNVYNVQLFTQSSEYSFDGAEITEDFQKYITYYGTFWYFPFTKLALLTCPITKTHNVGIFYTSCFRFGIFQR